jgi:hypothetical protein
MPYMTNGKRDYKKQNAKYDSKPSVKKDRASRNAARRAMVAGGLAKKGDGKDVDHKDGNPRNNKRSNLRVQTKAKNRSVARTSSNKKKG